MLGDGITLQEPSDDKHIPAEQGLALILPHPYDAIHCNTDPRYTAQMDDALPNVPTPKRPGDPLDAPSTKEPRTSRDIEEPTAEINLTDFGLPS